MTPIHTHTVVLKGRIAEDIQQKKAEVLGIAIYYPEMKRVIVASDEKLPEGYALDIFKQFIPYAQEIK